MKKIAKKLKERGVDTSKIDLDKAIRYCEESTKLEHKRL